MTVVRISIMRTSSDVARTAANKRTDVERFLDELEDHLSVQQGYIMGFRFSGQDDDSQVGRVSLWRSHEDADRAATQEHTVAVRSQIHLLIDPGHLEAIGQVTGNPRNIP